jgi:hypothetical protein
VEPASPVSRGDPDGFLTPMRPSAASDKAASVVASLTSTIAGDIDITSDEPGAAPRPLALPVRATGCSVASLRSRTCPLRSGLATCVPSSGALAEPLHPDLVRLPARHAGGGVSEPHQPAWDADAQARGGGDHRQEAARGAAARDAVQCRRAQDV